MRREPLWRGVSPGVGGLISCQRLSNVRTRSHAIATSAESEDRTDAVRTAEAILRWLLGLDDLSSEDIAGLRNQWRERLIPAQTPSDENAMWAQVEELRGRIARG